MNYPKTALLSAIVLALLFSGVSAFADSTPSCDSTMWLPDASTITSNSDGSLTIDPPGSFAYLGYDDSAMLAMVAATKCSCTCTANPGTCSPSIYNGDCSCTAKDGCTACDLTTSGASSEVGLSFGGYMDIDAGVSFVYQGDTDYPAVFRALFDQPEVQDALTAFIETIYGGAPVPQLIDNGEYLTAPEGHELAAINAFGRVTFLAIPASMVGVDMVAADSGSCSCSDGSCTYDSTTIPFKGTFHYCEGSCQGTCTLTMGASSASGYSEEYSFTSYTH